MSNPALKEAVVALREDNYDKMRTLIKSVLTEKAVEKIDELKVKVAKNYLK